MPDRRTYLLEAASEFIERLANKTDSNDRRMLVQILEDYQNLSENYVQGLKRRKAEAELARSTPTQKADEAEGLCRIKKADDELQIVWSEVYVPMKVDTHGDFMRTDEIRKMAYNFMAQTRNHAIDVQHDQKEDRWDHVVIESFIAREGDPTFVEGAWVLGVHIPDKSIWKDVKEGKLNGFSLDAMVKKQTTTIEVEVDMEVAGQTSETDQHRHNFVVRFNEDGEFLGGSTDVVDGHQHVILKETATEEGAGHRHRFSIIGDVKAVA
jgi:hypothetical protein